jgi:arginine exporter protein ArgO
MQINLPCLVVFNAALVATHSARAHHSAAQFDVERTVSLHAVVTEFEWANPHVYIDI